MAGRDGKRPQHPPEPERNVTGWRSDTLDLPEWCWRHISDAQGDKLKPMTLYRHLLGYSGLAGPTRSVLRFLADRSDYRGHSFPKLDVIARRTGYSKRAVSDAIKDAERNGWVIADRRMCGKGFPADYWLDVPDLAVSPCADEPPANVWSDDVNDDESEPSPADSGADLMRETHEGHAGDASASSASRMSLMQETHDASGFKHLGSTHLGSEHLRSASQSRHQSESQDQVVERLRRFIASSLTRDSSRDEREDVREEVERHLQNTGQPLELADVLMAEVVAA